MKRILPVLLDDVAYDEYWVYVDITSILSGAESVTDIDAKQPLKQSLDKHTSGSEYDG